MKNIKLVLLSTIICSAIMISSCGNTNQSSVVANNDAEITTIANEILAEQTKHEASEESIIIDEVSSQQENTQQQNTQQQETQQQIIQQETELPTEAIESEEENTMSNNNILVAYFSATGTTKRVAEKIAELTGADIYEIVPQNPYSDADLNWNDRNSRSTKEMDDPNVRPEIGSSDIDLAPYTTIYLGYPIWWGDAPRIMATFVEKYNFDGKKVIPFCTSGGSGIGRSGSNLGTLAGSGSFASGERLNSSADTNNIQNFINNNK